MSTTPLRPSLRNILGSFFSGPRLRPFGAEDAGLKDRDIRRLEALVFPPGLSFSEQGIRLEVLKRLFEVGVKERLRHGPDTTTGPAASLRRMLADPDFRVFASGTDAKRTLIFSGSSWVMGWTASPTGDGTFGPFPVSDFLPGRSGHIDPRAVALVRAIPELFGSASEADIDAFSAEHAPSATPANQDWSRAVVPMFPVERNEGGAGQSVMERFDPVIAEQGEAYNNYFRHPGISEWSLGRFLRAIDATVGNTPNQLSGAKARKYFELRYGVDPEQVAPDTQLGKVREELLLYRAVRDLVLMPVASGAVEPHPPQIITEPVPMMIDVVD